MREREREREFARRRRLVAVLECEVSEWSSAETYFVNRAPPLHNNTHTHIHIYTNTSLWQYTLIPTKKYTNTSSPPASTQTSIHSLYKTPQHTIQNTPRWQTSPSKSPQYWGSAYKTRLQKSLVPHGCTSMQIHKHLSKPQQPQYQYTTTWT